jgi:hypothetical protein
VVGSLPAGLDYIGGREKTASVYADPEFDKAMRKLVKVPKEAIERAEKDESRKGKE